MQKSSFTEALLIVAIVSAVGYGTVVIRAMTTPNGMGENPMEQNQGDVNAYDQNGEGGDRFWKGGKAPLGNDPQILGGNTSPDQGGGGEFGSNGAQEGSATVGAQGGVFEWNDTSQGEGGSPDTLFEDRWSAFPQGSGVSSMDVEEKNVGGDDGWHGGDWNRGATSTDSWSSVGQDGDAVFNADPYIKGDPYKGDEEDPDEGITSNNEEGNDTARNEWFEAARERLMRGAPPEDFPGGGVTEGVFPGQGATEAEFPGGTGLGPWDETNGPIEFGGTQSDVSGESGGDDVIRPSDDISGSVEEDSEDEEYGPEEYAYPEEEVAAPTEEGEDNDFFQRFLDFVSGEKTPGNKGSRTSFDEGSQPEESESTDNADRSGGNRIVDWFKSLFGGF